ncbi:5054_t:CDS:2, partial [Paraglomus brasilianum]
ASLIKAQFQTGDVALASQTSWYVCSSNPTDIASYSVTTYNQTVTSTPNFGNTRNGFSTPDVPPCTQSFVSVVVDPTNFPMIFNGLTFLAWMHNHAQQTAWCLVVSNPNTAAICLRISYTFTDPTNAATSTPTNNTVNGGASPTSGSGSYTTTIVLPSVSGVQKISWNSKGILVIALACVVVIQSFMALI